MAGAGGEGDVSGEDGFLAFARRLRVVSGSPHPGEVRQGLVEAVAAAALALECKPELDESVLAVMLEGSWLGQYLSEVQASRIHKVLYQYATLVWAGDLALGGIWLALDCEQEVV